MPALLQAFLGLGRGVGGYKRGQPTFPRAYGGGPALPSADDDHGDDELLPAPLTQAQRPRAIPNMREIMEAPIVEAEDDSRRNIVTLPDLPTRRDLPIAAPNSPPDVPMPDLNLQAEAPRDWRGREIRDPLSFEKNQYMRAGQDSGGKVKRDWKMTLLNAFVGAGMGMRQGGGLGALGGAAAGAIGSLVNPEAGREFGFEQFEQPDIEAGMARGEALRQRANTEASARLEAERRRADIDFTRARTEVARRPPVTPPRRANLQIGVNRATGKREWFDAGDPAQLEAYEPDPKPASAHWVRDEKGRYVNLNAPDNARKPVKGYDRPSSPRRPAAEKKYVSITKVREYAGAKGISESEAAAQARADGYTVVK